MLNPFGCYASPFALPVETRLFVTMSCPECVLMVVWNYSQCIAILRVCESLVYMLLCIRFPVWFSSFSFPFSFLSNFSWNCVTGQQIELRVCVPSVSLWSNRLHWISSLFVFALLNRNDFQVSWLWFSSFYCFFCQLFAVRRNVLAVADSLNLAVCCSSYLPTVFFLVSTFINAEFGMSHNFMCTLFKFTHSPHLFRFRFKIGQQTTYVQFWLWTFVRYLLVRWMRKYFMTYQS